MIICLMLILDNLLVLKSKQGVITDAFLHANLEEKENVFAEMHLGLQHDPWLIPGPSCILDLSS